MKPFKAIAAMSLNRAIGKNNQLPWSIPDEFKWFKSNTLDHAMLMGRKTYESIGKPLPRRLSIVLSRTIEEELPPGGKVIRSIDELKNIDLPPEKNIWICGGEEIYRLTLPYCSDLYLTVVNLNIEDADAFFPNFEDTFQNLGPVKETEEFTVYHYKNNNLKTL